MITSRQIVELIKKEKQKEARDEVKLAYQKIIDRIEVLEDIDMASSVSRWEIGGDNEEKTRARKEFDQLFSKNDR